MATGEEIIGRATRVIRRRRTRPMTVGLDVVDDRGPALGPIARMGVVVEPTDAVRGIGHLERGDRLRGILEGVQIPE